MPNELDPILLRLFAEARRTLPDTQFHAHLNARLHRVQEWRTLPFILWSTCSTILSGCITGLAAPFRVRSRPASLLAIAATALMVWMALEGV
jgi:hypothetical protein